MARASHTTLTKRHEAILEYTWKYYEKNKVGPLHYNLKKQIGATKEEINQLFPQGIYSIFTWTGIPIQKVDNPCKPISMIKVDNLQKVYLDHNATTYIRPEVSRVLTEYYNGNFGYANPSSSTIEGKMAYEHINSTRMTIADCLSVDPEEIIFTGSGSEANNLAIKGIAFNHIDTCGHIITSKIEHASVLRTMEYLETLGFTISYVDVQKNGLISPEVIKKAIKHNTILVSIMLVNNEIGTINPIEEIGSICRKEQIPFMVDGVQGFGKIPLNPADIGISFLSFSGHKIYAPKGIGGLYLNHKININPLIHGGDQEMGFRSGTENVGHIIALGQAVKLTFKEMKSEWQRILELRNFFLTELRRIEPNFHINGSMDERIPHNLSIAFPHVDSNALLLSLNSIGINVSAGSSCSSGKTGTSHVLKAIGANTLDYGTIRFSFGLKTTKKGLEYLFAYLPEILQQIKEG